MKRYQFRMDKVLRVRRLQEDAARAGVSVARSAERAAQAAVAQSSEHYRALAGATTAPAATEFLAQRDRVAFRATSVRLAEGRLATAAAATEQAVVAWRATHQRVEALERLDSRRREEHGTEARRAEDVAVDEIVVARARART